MAARRAHHSKLLEVFPELCLAAVVGNAPNKNLVGFAAVAPGSFLLSRRGWGKGKSVTSEGTCPHRLASHNPFPWLCTSEMAQAGLKLSAALLPWAL